ncbi:MAG: S8 family serine peptidase [Thermoguttaceae bacterium]
MPPYRRHTARLSRFESVEPRLLLSGEPLGDFRLDYYVDDQSIVEVAPSLIEAHELTGLDQVRADYGFSGQGQTVVVIDTGIAYDHVALGGGFGSDYQVVGGFDFSERDADPYDDGLAGSHGTHVAGIIAGSGSNAPGVAPGVDLIALRVFGDDGYGSFGQVEQALQWVHNNRNAFEYPITTVNLSLGSDLNSHSVPSWATLENELARLEADGMFIAVAAGNGFSQNNQTGLSYPAVSTHVVPVASLDDNGTLSYFSQRTPWVIAAPGRGVLSTVPDYVGNRNGTDDDFARYSGTSMAAPYVAGASVLLREAYEFVGMTSVSQETLYDLMVTTADTLFDSVTGQNYYSLNLDAAFDAVMPVDDFPSLYSEAYGLGTIDDSLSLSGTIERLGDQDWFSFTAGQTGTVGFALSATAAAAPRWIDQSAGTLQTSGSLQTASIDDDGLLSMDVIAGQTYVVGLGAGGTLSRYTIDVTLDATSGYTDFGTVRQQSFDDFGLSADGRWFVVTAAGDGTLTIEAFFSNAAGDVDLQLFDVNHNQLAYAYSTADFERIDIAATAGETFLLRAFVYGGGANNDVDFRVTNLVSQAGGTLSVLGTTGNDSFFYSAASPYHDISINGVEYRFAPMDVANVNFDGLAGVDSAILSGTTGNDRAVLRPASAELAGSGYHLLATSVENISLGSGGGEDSVIFYDSSGDDVFFADPLQAILYGEGFDNLAEGFRTVHADARLGGTDVARLFDSAGNDTFLATPMQGVMFGEGFYNRARNFDAVHASADAGGNDTALMYDSAGNDTFLATPVQGVMFGEGFYNRAKHFDAVYAYGTVGGDVARFYDSVGNGTFENLPGQSVLFGDGFYNRAKGFATVGIYAAAGQETADLPDTAADTTAAGVALPAAGQEAETAGQPPHDQASRVRGLLLESFAAWVYDFQYGPNKPGLDDDRDDDRDEISAVDLILQSQPDWDRLG